MRAAIVAGMSDTTRTYQLAFPYRVVGDEWYREQLVATGHVPATEFTVIVDLPDLPVGDRARALAVADRMHTFSGLPGLPAPTEDPAVVIGAWDEHLERVPHRAQVEAEVAAWADDHGSQVLQLMAAAGQARFLRYGVERAMVDLPGSLPDPGDHVVWRPSLAEPSTDGVRLFYRLTQLADTLGEAWTMQWVTVATVADAQAGLPEDLYSPEDIASTVEHLAEEAVRIDDFLGDLTVFVPRSSLAAVEARLDGTPAPEPVAAVEQHDDQPDASAAEVAADEEVTVPPVTEADIESLLDEEAPGVDDLMADLSDADLEELVADFETSGAEEDPLFG